MLLPDDQIVDDSELRLLGDSAEAFLAVRASSGRLRAGGPVLDSDIWAAMAEQGWLGMCLPEAQGGLGMDASAACVLTEAFGAALLPEPFIAMALMPSLLLAALPGAGDEIAAGIAAGERLVTVAWQEAAENLAPLPRDAVVERNGDHLVLRGRKVCVPAIASAGEWLVTAVLDGASALLRVDPALRGVEVEHVQLVDGTRMGAVSFAQVRLDETAVLAWGEEVERATARMIAGGQLALAAQLYGIAKASLHISLRYMETRVQFGSAIARFQSLRHRAVDLKIGLELARAALRDARRPHGAGDEAISAAKASASEAAVATSRAGIQLHGAMGFSDEADIGLYHKAALTGAAWLGSARLHRTTSTQGRGRDRESA
ncbi:acyl-CoA dehydrogenase family protein [Xanthobacter sp. 91]|uniref:acyl-CoA dehydrogenase family protein n=1 Tax=Xanthobacter sp. 91 TaxID=1117244 RepID=UPI0004980CBA|nr:acyl-CoA dehydrogenase family protein [Xanthobacter sp. 91]